ncbi:hypothetical protein C8J57DRAFT_1275640 [Mycena rebaudengoi]|nr:hypothetical protein C8J57DRAFT_1275640 [Mycena rebaudengoi]
MTEYDYSPEARQRYMATQNRIANWVDKTESYPHLKSPFTPRSSTGSASTARPQHYSSSHTSSSKTPTTQSSRGAMTHQFHRSSHATSRPPTSAHRSQMHPTPSRGYSRAGASTVSPSHSISQAPGPMQPIYENPRSHHSSHRSSHHSQRHQQSPSYVISPPSSPRQGSSGVVIIPRGGGRTPHVIYY